MKTILVMFLFTFKNPRGLQIQAQYQFQLALNNLYLSLIMIMLQAYGNLQKRLIKNQNGLCTLNTIEKRYTMKVEKAEKAGKVVWNFLSSEKTQHALLVCIAGFQFIASIEKYRRSHRPVGFRTK